MALIPEGLYTLTNLQNFWDGQLLEFDGDHGDYLSSSSKTDEDTEWLLLRDVRSDSFFIQCRIPSKCIS